MQSFQQKNLHEIIFKSYKFIVKNKSTKFFFRSPANVDAAKEWRENYPEFKRKVARCVRKSQEELLWFYHTITKQSFRSNKKQRIKITLIAAEIITDIIVIFSSKIEILSYHNKHKVEEVKKKNHCLILFFLLVLFLTHQLLLFPPLLYCCKKEIREKNKP